MKSLQGCCREEKSFPRIFLSQLLKQTGIPHTVLGVRVIILKGALDCSDLDNRVMEEDYPLSAAISALKENVLLFVLRCYHFNPSCIH